MVYNHIKREQEEEDAHHAAKPSHLNKPSGCSLTAVLYPERTGSSIHQQFTKKYHPQLITILEKHCIL